MIYEKEFLNQEELEETEEDLDLEEPEEEGDEEGLE